MLELAVVVVFGLATAVVTLETWPGPYVPMFWAMLGLVVFSLYRLAFQLWGTGVFSEATDAGGVRTEAAEADSPDQSDEQLKQQTGEIAGIDMERVDETILRTPSDEGYEAEDSEASNSFLDWDDAVETGLVSIPEPEDESEGSGEAR